MSSSMLMSVPTTVVPSPFKPQARARLSSSKACGSSAHLRHIASRSNAARTSLGRIFPQAEELVQRSAASTACKAASVSAMGAAGIETIKQDLSSILEGKERGLFGLKADVKKEIQELVERLEAMNPQEKPLDNIECVAGEWRVLYSTIKITGAKRTKLGLREFVKISDMVQIINPETNTAVNEVRFNVMGLGSISGALTITATYEPVSDNRVAIRFESSVLEPSALQKIFEKNYDMLLGIFNPEGWLDITYVDDSYRVGRDDKGNIFILERA